MWLLSSVIHWLSGKRCIDIRKLVFYFCLFWSDMNLSDLQWKKEPEWKKQRDDIKQHKEEKKMCIFFVAVNVRCACAIHSSSASKATRMTTTMEYMQSCPIVNRKSDIIKHPFSTITNQEIKNLSSNTVFLLNDISRKRSAIDVFIFQFLFSFGMCAWYPQPADTRTKLAASRSVSMQGSSDSDQFFSLLLVIAS